MTKSSRVIKPVVDDEYKAALQPMIDDALLAHNLAPAVVSAIEYSKPLNDVLQKVFLEAIENNASIHTAIDKVVEESAAIKKSKIDYRQPGFWLAILIPSIIAAVVSIMLHFFF